MTPPKLEKQDQRAKFLKSYLIDESSVKEIAKHTEGCFANDLLRVTVRTKEYGDITLLEYLDKKGAIRSIKQVKSIPPRKVNKRAYDKETNNRKKFRHGEDYMLAESVTKLSKNGHYESFQAHHVYPPSLVRECAKSLFTDDTFTAKTRLNTTTISTRFFDKYINRAKVKHTYIDSNGVPIDHLMYEQFSTRMTADIVKEMYSFFMGGYSYADVTADKDAMYIYAGKHINHHSSQQPLSLWRLYVQSLIGSFESYCFSGILSQCLSCGSCSTKEEIHHIIKDNTPDANSHLVEVVKKNVAKRRDAREFILIKGEVLESETDITTRIYSRHLNAVTLRSLLLSTPKRRHEDVVPHVHGSGARNTRQLARNHNEEVCAFGGVYYQSVPINPLVGLSEYVEEVNEGDLNIRQAVGVRVDAVKRITQGESVRLSNDVAVHMRYTFKNKNQDYSKPFIIDAITRTFEGSDKLFTKKRVAKDQFSTRIDLIEFDPMSLYAFKVYLNNQGDTILDVLVKADGFNPTSWLAGLVSLDKPNPINTSRVCSISMNAIEYVYVEGSGGVNGSIINLANSTTGDVVSSQRFNSLNSVWTGHHYEFFD